ncbi:MAG: hemolysin family protein [Dysgonamonadaceae bacterium]|jgi:putative hemolysin|nr:hemolysin family protein [Dysgonamonadaceae bacterium]
MEILIILGLILMNGLLSMAEIALISARKSRLETDAKKGNKAAQTALKLAGQPDKFLSTIQIGITLIGIITGLYSGEAFAHDLAGLLETVPALAPYAPGIAKTTVVIVVTYFTLVLGELVPKRIGMNRAETVSRIMAQPMYLLSRITTPFVWLLSRSTTITVRLLGIPQNDDNKITEEEIKAIVKEGYDVGEVQEVEQDIVERVFNLGDRNVGSIMTHRSDLVWLDLTDSNEKIREKVQENLYNTYPVISETFHKMRGVVYLKDLFGKIYTPDFSLEELIRPVQYLPENLSVYKALEQFRDARVKYGIVTDEFGDVQGIVTLKDIMEALVGEMPEIGEERELVERPDGSLLVDGQYSFYNFLEYFDMEDLYADYDYNTLSGLILEILQHVPQTGEKLAWLHFEFEIMDMDGARIDKVLVKRQT